MTDEETDVENDGGFVQRMPKWRSDKLSKLLTKLDENITSHQKLTKQGQQSHAGQVHAVTECHH